MNNCKIGMLRLLINDIRTQSDIIQIQVEQHLSELVDQTARLVNIMLLFVRTGRPGSGSAMEE